MKGIWSRRTRWGGGVQSGFGWACVGRGEAGRCRSDLPGEDRHSQGGEGLLSNFPADLDGISTAVKHSQIKLFVTFL